MRRTRSPIHGFLVDVIVAIAGGGAIALAMWIAEGEMNGLTLLVGGLMAVGLWCSVRIGRWRRIRKNGLSVGDVFDLGDLLWFLIHW